METGWSKYLNVKDLARYLGMSKSWLYQHWPEYVSTNRVRTYRIGRKILFNRADIDRVMEKTHLA